MTDPLNDEETPLLPLQKLKKTPFPWLQFSIVTCLRVLEPLHSHVISPFLPQLIRDIGITHGKESQVGYYVGVIASAFYISQAISAPLLSIVSDQVGRRRVLSVCLVGLSASVLGFGLSKTFWGLVLSWGINGASNGVTVLVKSLIMEITDATNIAQACAYYPVGFHIGTTIAPLIGGSLSRPAERFPLLFGAFFKKYPYFLPCAVTAVLTASVGLVTIKYLKETVKNPVPFSRLFSVYLKDDNDSVSALPQGVDPVQHSETPLPLRALLTPPVLIAAGNYAFLSLVATSHAATNPLFLSTPVELGGLGLPVATIGTVLSANEVVGGLLQVLFFQKAHDIWGSKTVFVAGIASMVPVFLCFPIISSLAGKYGMNLGVWALIGFQMVLSAGLSFSYGAVLIFVAAAAPNKASIGATNGVCQISVSVLKGVGPALAGSLFSLSLERGYLGGYLVYFVLLGITMGGGLFAMLLPKKSVE